VTVSSGVSVVCPNNPCRQETNLCFANFVSNKIIEFSEDGKVWGREEPFYRFDSYVVR
jgi:hypothetical protein